MKDRIAEIDKHLALLENKERILKNRYNKIEEEYKQKRLNALKPTNEKRHRIYKEKRELELEREYIIQSRCEHKNKTTRKRGDHYTEYFIRICADCGQYFGEV